MNITFITYNFPPISCGVGDYTFNLAQQFKNNGHKVSIICGTHFKPYSDLITDFQVFPLLQKGKLHCLKDTIIELTPDKVLVQYVPGIYSKWYMPYSLVILAFLLKINNIHVDIMFHEVRVRFAYNFKRFFLAFNEQIIAILVSLLANNIITSIPFYKKLLLLWKNKISVIPIGSNIPEIKLNDTELANFRLLYAKPNEKIICTFGIREHNFIIKIFEELQKTSKDYKLIIIGKTLNQTIISNNQVFLTGFIDASEVYKHLLISDLFLFPEFVGPKGDGGICNKSGSLAAAFAAGLPIVGTKGDMTSEILIKSNAIEFIKFNNVSEASTCIKALLEDNQKLNEMRVNSLSFTTKICHGTLFLNNTWNSYKLEINKLINASISNIFAKSIFIK